MSGAPVLDNENVNLLSPTPPFPLIPGYQRAPSPFKSEEEEEEEAGADIMSSPNANDTGEMDDDARSTTSSVSSTPKSAKPKKLPTPEQLALAEQLEKLFLDVSQTDRVAVLEIVQELVVKKKCACGKRLMGQYLELGTCSDCTPKKKGADLKCPVCDSKLVMHFRELGLCSRCNKNKQQREEKAAKDAAKKK